MGDHSLGVREPLLNNSLLIDEGPGFEICSESYYVFFLITLNFSDIEID